MLLSNASKLKLLKDSHDEKTQLRRTNVQLCSTFFAFYIGTYINMAHMNFFTMYVAMAVFQSMRNMTLMQSNVAAKESQGL
jgi:hypothetical protein